MAAVEDALHDEVDAMERLQERAGESIEEIREATKEMKATSLDDFVDLLEMAAEAYAEDLADLSTEAFGIGAAGVRVRGKM